MFRRNRLWRLGLASALFLSWFLAQKSCAEERRAVSLESRLALGWSLLKDNSLYADRLPDWDECRRLFAQSADGGDEASTDAAMNKLLGAIHDDYTFYRNRVQTTKYKQNTEQRGLVQYALGPNNVAYIKLKTFASVYAADEMRDALRTLACADSYVLDLRGNRGGLVNQAFLVYSMFVDEGKFVSFRGRNCGDKYTETLTVTRTRLKREFNQEIHLSKRTANLTGHKPVMVLVDRDTRSASELLAGALRDSGRAQLIGSRTFGKGVVQDTWSLDDGSSIRITTGRSYLSKSGCIDGLGLEPDRAMLPDLTTISAR